VPGEVRVDAYRLALLPHTPPGEYRLITGFYDRNDGGWQRLLAEGRDHVPLATVSIAPARQPAATLHPLACAFEGGLRLTGVDYDRSVAGQLRLYLHFSCSVPTGALQVQALRGGQVIAQGNLAALPAGAASTLALDVPDGPEPLFLRLATPQGRALARLGPWHWPLGAGLRLRPPQGAVHYVPLGGEMVFTGFGRLGSEASRGQTLWLRPRFLAARPLSADYTVSVGLAQDGWECKTDGTPGLGAIPTLKWVRGWLVEDAHPLALPADAPTGTLHTVLTVYDAFTLAPLPVLDERLVRQGQGIRLELDSVRVH